MTFACNSEGLPGEFWFAHLGSRCISESPYFGLRSRSLVSMYRNSACGAGSMGSIARVAVGSQSNAASARARRNLVAP